MNNQIKSEINKIEVPCEIRDRTISGIKMAKQELNDKEKNSRVRSPRRKIVAAVLLATIITAGIGDNYTTLAKMIGGYFQDITNWNGAITGEKYVDATEDISITPGNININTDNVTVGIEVELLKGEEPPYSITEALTIGDYIVTTNSGKEISSEDITIKPKNKQSHKFDILDKDKLLSQKVEANVKTFEGDFIFDSELSEFEDIIIINIKSLYSQAIGEAPLEITGDWTVEIPIEK